MVSLEANNMYAVNNVKKLRIEDVIVHENRVGIIFGPEKNNNKHNVKVSVFVDDMIKKGLCPGLEQLTLSIGKIAECKCDMIYDTRGNDIVVSIKSVSVIDEVDSSNEKLKLKKEDDNYMLWMEKLSGEYSSDYKGAIKSIIEAEKCDYGKADILRRILEKDAYIKSKINENGEFYKADITTLMFVSTSMIKLIEDCISSLARTELSIVLSIMSNRAMKIKESLENITECA